MPKVLKEDSSTNDTYIAFIYEAAASLEELAVTDSVLPVSRWKLEQL